MPTSILQPTSRAPECNFSARRVSADRYLRARRLRTLTRPLAERVSRHAADLPVTVTASRLDSGMGRKAKGARELLGTRPSAPLAEAARSRAEDCGLTMSDYLAALIARATDMAHLAPALQPLVDSRLELPFSDSWIDEPAHFANPKADRPLLGTRPLLALAEAARVRADEAGLTMSDYLAQLIANDTGLARLAPVSRAITDRRQELPIRAA